LQHSSLHAWYNVSSLLLCNLISIAQGSQLYLYHHSALLEDDGSARSFSEHVQKQTRPKRSSRSCSIATIERFDRPIVGTAILADPPPETVTCRWQLLTSALEGRLARAQHSKYFEVFETGVYRPSQRGLLIHGLAVSSINVHLAAQLRDIAETRAVSEPQFASSKQHICRR
jgi:hypothetical protein